MDVYAAQRGNFGYQGSPGIKQRYRGPSAGAALNFTGSGHPQRVYEPLNRVAEVLVASYLDQLGRDLIKRPRSNMSKATAADDPILRPRLYGVELLRHHDSGISRWPGCVGLLWSYLLEQPV
jgi:hypothetical protein